MIIWPRVSEKNPCPICQKPDWCTITPNGKKACCMRVPSGEPAVHNGGWMHVLGNDTRAQPFVPIYSPPLPPPAPIDCESLLAAWAKCTTGPMLAGLGDALGLSAASLVALSAVWAPTHHAWAFPMRSGDNKVVGIRLRNNQGQKWAVKGSHQGAFIPQHVTPQDVLYACEGPTDTAAMLGMGLYAAGRASCQTGAMEINALCQRQRVRRVVIVVDNDAPGIAGARKLANELRGVRYAFYMPPCKDVRQFRNAGGTATEINNSIADKIWKETL